MKIAVYNENTTRAGRWVDEETIARYEEEHGTEDCGDWTIYEGSARELEQVASTFARRKGGGGAFDRRIVESIREAVSYT
jgi:hypothetical protein